MNDLPTPRFIVGTGRCGSTLLSQMLGENPELLSIHEILVGIGEHFRFKREPVSGSELAQQLRMDSPLMTIAHRQGIKTSTFSYPVDRPNMRYKLEDPVPWILSLALPYMTDDPDKLFDDLIEQVESYPTQSLSLHYQLFLGWMTEHLGKQYWIERSGASMGYLSELIEFFPGAKVLHLHRDGRDAATSMQALPILRAAGALSEGEPAVSGEQGIIELLTNDIPIEILGRYWSNQILAGLEVIPQIAPANFLQVRFEDLVLDTRATLEHIAEFFEIGEGDWIDRAAAHSRGIPASRYPDLSAAQQMALNDACREVMHRLDRNC
ncbi:MAG: sulfotransferase [Halieaceae bacterium]|nr:sulfotransferase [Halieaceae bacterium]